MSRHGVTYWSDSENNFTELEEWMGEFDKYSKLIKVSLSLYFLLQRVILKVRFSYIDSDV